MNIWRAFSIFLYRNRVVAKRAISLCKRILPRSASKVLTDAAEKIAFVVLSDYQANTLPPIFHYWSAKYLAPQLAKFEINSPEGLYFREAVRMARSPEVRGKLKITSLGSGAGHMELDLLDRLLKLGVDAELHCVDFNPSLKKAAMGRARRMELEHAFEFYVEDCNNLASDRRYDVIIVNQFFHHVEELEFFCSSIKRQLEPHGVLLTCDVVGQNGHVLWPSVDGAVQRWWKQLPERLRFDRYFNQKVEEYVSVDHSAYSNEGIRAQDVVKNLLDSFHFEVFITYGAAIVPFIERRIGFNFDPNLSDDSAIISRIADADERSVNSGAYPASNMIAVLRHSTAMCTTRFHPVSPHQFVAMVELEKVRACADSA